MNDDSSAPSWGEDFAFRLRQQELVAEFGLFAMQARDLQTVLDEATIVAAQGLQTKFSKVLEHQPADKAFLVRAGVGWKDGVVGHARIGDELDSPAGYSFRVRKPVVSNHLGSETRFRTPDLLVQHGIHSAINVIVGAGDDAPYGVLEVDSSSRDRFVGNDTLFLQALANTLATALHLHKRQDFAEALLKEKERLLHEKDHLLKEKDDLLREKELLAREIDHRVTNSLQMVQTVLTLQARGSSNEIARKMLKDAASRIMAIGAVHRWLYQGPTGTEVDGRLFLGSLLDELGQAVLDNASDRSIRLNLEPIRFTAETAMPIGLIVTELVVNALKYGRGDVCVTVLRPPKAVEIIVDDEGDGFPPDLDLQAGAGLGMRLVSALANSRQGVVQIDPSVKFSRIRVRF